MQPTFRNTTSLSFTALSLIAAAACRPTGPASGVLADAPAAQKLPLLVAHDASAAGSFFVYTKASADAASVLLCLEDKIEACIGSAKSQALSAFDDGKQHKLFVSKSLPMTGGQTLHLLSLSADGKTTIESRSFQLAATDKIVPLASPKEKQVFQRKDAATGQIVLQLKATDAPGAKYAKARVSGTAASNGVTANGHWVDLELKADTNGNAVMRLDAPAGGWFAVDVLFYDETKKQLTGKAHVAQVGVGEVFLVAGQSNSTNCGRVPQTVDNDFVVSTDGDKWQKGDDPQLGTHDDSLCNNRNGQTHGGSNWPNTGNALVKKYKVPVAFASTGFSGTAIRQWLPTETTPPDSDSYNLPLFEYTARRAVQLTAVGGFRAVLWHQGENDAKDNTTSQVYQQSLTSVITGLRDRISTPTPWLIAVASWCEPGSYGPEWKGGSTEITSAQQALVSQKTLPDLYAGASTDDLLQDYRGLPSDPHDCHFNDKGLKEVGKRWADKVTAFVDQKVGG